MMQTNYVTREELEDELDAADQKIRFLESNISEALADTRMLMKLLSDRPHPTGSLVISKVYDIIHSLHGTIDYGKAIGL